MKNRILRNQSVQRPKVQSLARFLAHSALETNAKSQKPHLSYGVTDGPPGNAKAGPPAKRQFWAYCGLALETRTSAEYRFEEGQLVRAKKPVFIRGLNLNHNHDLKNLFKGAATAASAMPGPFHSFYENLLLKGMQPAMARLTLARKIAAITLCVWKKGEPFDADYLKPQAA